MATTAATIPRTTSPRRLYVGLALLATAIVLVGFWPSYFGALVGDGVDRPLFIHFHAAVYMGWLALFVTQTLLVATGRTDLHMRLGRFAIGYGVLVIVAGLVAAFGMFTSRVHAGDLVAARRQLIGPLLDMLVFAPVFAAAVYYRRKPELHKRLMIVATTSLLIAAVGRMPFFGQPRNLLLVQLVWSAPILVAMAHDLWRQRRVSAIYTLGLIALALEGPAMRLAVRDTAAWGAVTDWLARWV
jgi:hypothetical protein